MTISIPLKWGISTTAVPLLKQPKFSRFGTHFDDMPKILTYRQISPNIFLKKWKQKSVKHRAQREFFKFFIKKISWNRRICRDSHPFVLWRQRLINRVKWVRQQLTTVILWQLFLLSLSMLKVIEYLVAENKFGITTFWVRYFFRTSSF